ncbi:transmembrane protein 237-like isoform X2 [Hypanus sabinus]|uniref:transmembrane protein 237-like isoform X2 n=1 Tax=Hypanus sabinus TaxID=79690 RepID=UPI0028C3EC68|nr:transmembrane protein 237-like isoform X2 [Hypanus sabinus]
MTPPVLTTKTNQRFRDRPLPKTGARGDPGCRCVAGVDPRCLGCHSNGTSEMERDQAERPPRALPPLPSSETKDASTSKTKKKKARTSNGVDTLMSSTGRRKSESIEPLTPDLQDAPPQKKKKKRKLLPAADSETTFTQQSMSEVYNLYSGPNNELSRKTRKRNKRTRPAVHSNELEVEEDDIIDDGQAPWPKGPLFAQSLGSSQPVNKVFLERSRRFQAADRVEAEKIAKQVEVYMEVKSTRTTKDVSLQAHRGFRIIGLFSQGFLAGYTVWNIVVVYVLSGYNFVNISNLLQQYSMLVYPSQCLLYFLLAISTVSAFDRLNMADASMTLRRMVTLDPTAVASFLYVAALILSLSQQMASDKFNWYRSPQDITNATLWTSGSEFLILHSWVVVNLVATILVSLAWIFLSYQPMLDHTEEVEFGLAVNDTVEPNEKSKAQA